MLGSISGTSSPHMRGIASPHARAPQEAAPSASTVVRDQVALSSSRLSSAADASTDRQAQVLGLRKLALTAMIALGGLSAVVGATPALAAEPVTTAVTRQASPSAEEHLAQKAGLSSQTVDALRQNPELHQKALALPGNCAELYGGLNGRQRDYIANMLRGKTQVLFLTVDNREAFVNGSVAGQDAFPHMAEKIDDAVSQGRLTRPEGDSLKTSIGVLKSLTPAQRDTVATLIHLDRPLK